MKHIPFARHFSSGEWMTDLTDIHLQLQELVQAKQGLDPWYCRVIALWIGSYLETLKPRILNDHPEGAKQLSNLLQACDANDLALIQKHLHAALTGIKGVFYVSHR